MLVFDDGIDDRCERRIRPALPPVVAGFGQVSEVVDRAGADNGAAFAVKCYAPWITRALAKDLKLTSLRMDAKELACKFKPLAILLDDAGMKNAVEAIQPSIWPPCE